MKRNGLNLAALAARQAQLNPETALTPVKVKMPLPGRPSGVEVATYQALADAKLLASLTPEQQEAMERFHYAFRLRVGEVGMFLPPKYERLEPTTGNASDDKILRQAAMELEYLAWVRDAQIDRFDPRPCQHIAGFGRSITEAAKLIRMRRERCRDLFIEGLERFTVAGQRRRKKI